MTKTIVREWDTIGVIFIFILGSILHSAFSWVGYWRPAAWFLAVNESVWEHFKLAFWPGFLFALLEWVVIQKSCNNFWMAKSLGLLSMPVIIGVLFYGYTAVLGHSSFVVDIMIFLVAVSTGQWISYMILTAAPIHILIRQSTFLVLVAMTVAFAWFSYSPPHTFIFEDSQTHSYGIPKR
jgi:hypothetical protein